MSEKRKILFVHHFTLLGGATKSLYLIVRGLIGTDYEPSVVFLSERGAASDIYEKLGIDVYHLPGVPIYPHAHHAKLTFLSRKPFKPIGDLLKTHTEVDKVRAFLKDKDFDIIHLNTSLLLTFGIAAKKEGFKVVWHIREQLYPGNFGIRYRIVRNIIDKNSDRIIAISQTNANQLKDQSKVKVVYNYTNLSRNDNSFGSSESVNALLEEKAGNKKIVSFLGGTVHNKGLTILLKAAKLLEKKRSDLAIVLAGYPPSKPFRYKTFLYHLRNALLGKQPNDYCYELIENKQLPDNVHFTGFLDDVAPLLKQSSVLVWPATKSHFARPIIEAYGARVPVVATDLESSRELIDEPESGLVFPNKDHKALASSLESLLDDQSLGEQFKERGYKKAVEKFSGEKNFEEIIKVYDSLA